MGGKASIGGVSMFVFAPIFYWPEGGLMNENKSLMRNVRFTPAELAALRSMADERSCSVGAVVRWAVRKAVIADPPGRVQKNEGSAVTLDKSGAFPLSIQS
jgi:hypothetical protein